MKTATQQNLTVSASPDDVFQGALGVVQNDKNFDILAVHTEGRRLIARKKAKMSNAKVFAMEVVEDGSEATLRLVADVDPRMRKGLIDGKVVQKSAENYITAVRGAIDGTAPAPAEPVKNHYVQKKEQVPWTDPNEDPAIEMKFSWNAAAHEWF